MAEIYQYRETDDLGRRHGDLESAQRSRWVYWRLQPIEHHNSPEFMRDVATQLSDAPPTNPRGSHGFCSIPPAAA